MHVSEGTRQGLFFTMEISKIYQEDCLMTKYYMIRRLKLLVICSMTDINVNLHQWSTNSLIKNLETPLFIQC